MSAVLPDTAQIRADSASTPQRAQAALPATDRLSINRERIRRFLHGPEPGKSDSPDAPDAPRRWLDALRDHPIAGTIVDTVCDWWIHHPLSGVTRMAGSAARSAVQPLADRYPLALVGAALVTGAVLVWTRPWRWILRPALLAGIATKLAARALSRMPAASMIDVLTAVLAQKADKPRERERSKARG